MSLIRAADSAKTTNLARTVDESAVRLGGGRDPSFLRRSETAPEHDVDNDPFLVDRSLPSANQLPVDDHDVRDARVAADHRLHVTEPLTDRAAILVADEILIIVWQQMRRRNTRVSGSE